MTERVTMATMRHEAATLAAEFRTSNLQQAYRDTKARLAVDKAAYEKAYHEAYYKAYDLLKDK
jgi:hypothetical protein